MPQFNELAHKKISSHFNELAHKKNPVYILELERIYFVCIKVCEEKVTKIASEAGVYKLIKMTCLPKI